MFEIGELPFKKRIDEVERRLMYTEIKRRGVRRHNTQEQE